MIERRNRDFEDKNLFDNNITPPQVQEQNDTIGNFIFLKYFGVDVALKK